MLECMRNASKTDKNDRIKVSVAGWIPVSERLPEKYGTYLVAWKPCGMSEGDIIKRCGKPHYYEMLEYDPDDEALWIETIEQADGEYVILAWMPLPEPYRESEE